MILVSMSCWRERLCEKRPLVRSSGVKLGTVLRVATPIWERRERDGKESGERERIGKERREERERGKRQRRGESDVSWEIFTHTMQG